MIYLEFHGLSCPNSKVYEERKLPMGQTTRDEFRDDKGKVIPFCIYIN